MDKFDLKLKWEREGVVSIWLGNMDSEDDFEDYIEEQYEDDDAPMSKFTEEFGLGWYDHDFSEADFKDNPVPVEEFLSRNSYSSSFINEAVSAANNKGLENCGTKILLYNCEYDPATAPVSETQKLTFIGAFNYDINAPTAKQ